jgi:hypothetical protein
MVDRLIRDNNVVELKLYRRGARDDGPIILTR